MFNVLGMKTFMSQSLKLTYMIFIFISFSLPVGVLSIAFYNNIDVLILYLMSSYSISASTIIVFNIFSYSSIPSGKEFFSFLLLINVATLISLVFSIFISYFSINVAILMSLFISYAILYVFGILTDF